MRRNYTFLKVLLLCILPLLMVQAALAQDWSLVNPDVPSDLGTLYAMAADRHDVPYGFFYNFTTSVYKVAKYTASGWTQVGGPIAGLVDQDYNFVKMRIAPDGTLYLLCGVLTRHIKILQLQPGGSWMMIGNFTSGSICNFGYPLELDPSGAIYLAYPAPGNATTMIQKYLGSSNWQTISLPAYTRPFTPSLAFAADGTPYCFYQARDAMGNNHYYVSSYSFSNHTWQQVGSELSSSISVGLSPARIIAGRNPNQFYIYWGNGNNNTINCQVYNGSGTDWQVAGNPLDLSTNPPNNYISDWYLSGDGTGYYIFRGSSDNLIHAYKFDGANWQPLGTPFASTSDGYLNPISLASDPTHLYTGWRDMNSTTWHVSSYQIGKYPQNLDFPAIGARTYGDADPAFVRATSDVPSNPITYSIDHPEIANFTTDSTHIHILKAGTVIITAQQPGDNTYNPASVSQTLTINKATLTITGVDTIRAVGTANPVFRATYSGFVKGESAGILTTLPSFSCAANISSPVGSQWDIIPSGATAGNYSIQYVNGKLSIVPAGTTPQTIIFGSFPATTYGDADIPLTATASSSLQVGYVSSNPAVAIIVGGKVHLLGAGTTTITASQPGDLTYASASPVAQTLTVAPALLTITADDQVRDRGVANPPLTITYTGFVNGDDPGKLTTPAVATTTATISSAPGVYDIVVSGATSSNYNITFVNGHLTVKGTQLISWNPISTLTYGDAPIDPGAVSNTGVTPIYTTDNPAVGRISGSHLVITGAGTVTITATFPAMSGYDQTSRSQVVTVLPKALSVIADDQTRAYGGPNPVFTLHYIGFVNGDTAYTPGAFSQLPAATTTATASSPLGNYPIVPADGVSVNYKLNYIPGNLTITRAVRSISFPAIPVKTYGNADFDPGVRANTGETITYSSSDSSVATIVNGIVHIVGAGTATITASLPVNSSYDGPNSATQTISVNKAKLTITAENKIMTEGASPVRYTVTYQGLVNGDTWAVFDPAPMISSTATSQSPVGAYPITASGAGSPNYTISYVNGTLTVVPAADGSDNSLSAWPSSRGQLEVKVFTSAAQGGAIQLIGLSGQRMLTREVQLSSGLNQYQLPVDNMPAGVYILRVAGSKFKLDQKVLIH